MPDAMRATREWTSVMRYKDAKRRGTWPSDYANAKHSILSMSYASC